MEEQGENIKIKNPKQKENAYKGSFFFFLSVFTGAAALDQFVKHLIGESFKNSAFVFSLPLPVWLMYVIYAVVIASMIYYVLRNYQNFSFAVKLAWVLIFAGAASNIAERIFLGYVRDWIYITLSHWTGVYNLADGYIILGIIILILPLHKNSKNSDAGSQELGIKN